MQLTRRGRVVAGTAVVGFLLAAGFGARSLNAVVVPALVALLAGYLQLSNIEGIRVHRSVPADGFVGEQRDVELSFSDLEGDGVDRPYVATVRETLDDGLSAAATAFDTAVGTGPVSYEVSYEARGVQELGPATVTARDVLGLFERTFDGAVVDSVLVYPQIYRLSRWGLEELYRQEEIGRSQERDQFESIREYDRGDALRDLHWKSTAKRDELIVKEFASEAEAEAVTLSAGCGVDAADRMAEVTGSVVLALVEEGVPVEVSTPRGRVEVGPSRGNVTRLLRLLARVGPGRVREPEADVVVDVRGEAALVAVGEREYSFEELTADQPPVGDRREVAA